MSFTELPKHWKWVKLGDACKKISLNGIKVKQKEYLGSGKYPVIDQGQELIGGYFDDERLVVPAEPPYIIFGDHTKVKKFVLFRFIAGADGVKVLKPHPIYDPKFFFYLLHVVKIPDKGYARHFQFLEKAEIPLPPLAEQQRIVAKLEELFSELDAGLASLKTVAQQLKTYRQAVLKWAFEGKLTNDRVTESELPAGWKWERLDKLGDLGRGKSKHRPRNEKKLFGGKYPFIQTGEVKAAGHTIKTFEQTYSDFGLAQSKLWKKGTLCITIAAISLKQLFSDSMVVSRIASSASRLILI